MKQKLQSLREAATAAGYCQATYRRAWLRLSRPGIVAGGAVLLTAAEAALVAKEAAKPRKSRAK